MLLYPLHSLSHGSLEIVNDKGNVVHYLEFINDVQDLLFDGRRNSLSAKGSDRAITNAMLDKIGVEVRPPTKPSTRALFS